MCVGVLFACAFASSVYLVLMKTKRGCHFQAEAGATDSCELPGCLGPLQEQLALCTAEPSLQPLAACRLFWRQSHSAA